MAKSPTAENLRRAVEVNNVQAVRHALRMGADLNEIYSHGYNVLHIAVENNSIDALKYLCAMDSISINGLTMFLMTPLAVAIKEGKNEMVEILLDFGADPNIPIVFNQTVVHLAAYYKNHRVLHELIRNGAEVNVIDCFDQSPLSISILLVPNGTVTKILLEAGADPNFKSKSRMSILTEAILTVNVLKHFNVIKTLVDYGANVNDEDDVKKETPLHKAAAVGNARVLIHLFEHGAELSPLNVYNQTPLDLAKMHSNEKVRDILAFLEDNAIEEELRMLEALHGRELPDT